MNKIDAHSKTVRMLLNGVKYAIDFYQREYRWETKQISELMDDLEAKFLTSYEDGHERPQVLHYAHYFLGSIVISHKEDQNFLIDGQQRLTSLTLLLIYLHHLKPGRADIEPLIFSEQFGKKSYNLEVPERIDCLDALYIGRPFDVTDQPESVRNIVARYLDIEDHFPESLKDQALDHFIDWLLYNVDLVEITAYSDDDAYTIFETMNDRGLNLTPTDMLKGYLLANIPDAQEKQSAAEVWKQRLLQLIEVGKEEEFDFFKAWLRAKYAATIREGKKGATNKDFEKIGTTFHKWVRDEKNRIGLLKSEDFRDFIKERFARFSKHYLRMRQVSLTWTTGFEDIYFNAHHTFTLQYPLMLAPLLSTDDQESVERKMRLVATYIDIFIARRVVNYRTLGYSAIVYTMFNLMKDIRDLPVDQLALTLKEKVADMPETFAGGMPYLRLHQQNGHYVHHLLARMTYHIEQQSGVSSSFVDFISREIKKPFEIEHVWSNHYDQHLDEFSTEDLFDRHRNRLGGLVLLPRGFNQSFSDAPYEHKVHAYFGQNLLARSLNEQCYQNNPSFLAYLQRSGLPFKPHAQFKKADLEARQELYQQLCEEIWNPARFNKVLHG